VVVSDKAAAVEVHLTSGGNPIKNSPTVILLKDGISFTDFFRVLQRYMRPVSSAGGISFVGLVPGTYRAVRTAPDQPLPTTEPLFQAMLVDASRQSMPVTVDEGQTATINWDVP
jgi:hypothetical protein